MSGNRLTRSLRRYFGNAVDAEPTMMGAKITDSAPRSASSCEPYRELIERYVADGRHAMSIWQELVEKHGFTARYAAVQRFAFTAAASCSVVRNRQWSRILKTICASSAPAFATET